MKLMLSIAAPWMGMALLCTTSVVSAAAVEERVLDNGLKVLIKPDHRAPIVTSQVWYRVGSSYEHGGLTGVSHVLEHMMFKGTEKLGPGEFSRIVAENGGEQNAFTSRDYTAYYQNLAADRLEISFELEAERMRNLKLAEKEFLKELEVVKEERRMRTDDNPQALTFERFNVAAYEASPYRNPVIGWPSDLDDMTVDDLRNWYRRWYAPNNATLVVAGDVDPEQVFALAEKHFGPLAAEEISTTKHRLEPEQIGEKRIVVKTPAKEPYLIMGWKTPAIGHGDEDWEPYALEMLASVLDGGSSARFDRELVRRDRVAAAADASYSAFTRLPGMLLLDAVPATGKSVEDVEHAFMAQVERVQTELVAEDELKRIRTKLVAGKVFEKDAVLSMARQYGQMESIGLGWQIVDAYVDKLAAVTPEQIKAVAGKYLTADNLTVAVLEPQPVETDPAR